MIFEKRLQIFIVSAVFLICLAAGCSYPPNSPDTASASGIYIYESDGGLTAQMTAMDTFMTVSVRDGSVTSDALRGYMSLISGAEQRLSVTIPGSDIDRINSSGGKETAVSPETFDLIVRAADLCRDTGGALDITAYPLVKSWGFTGGADDRRVPGGEELSELLKLVGWDRISFGDGTVTVPPGTMIDLGAAAKGYAGDKLRDAMEADGVTSALLSLGGNIVCVGSKPDGSKWRVAIRDPEDLSSYIGYVDVTDTSVITSGGYERKFEDEDGNVYWHIIDPSTGYPAKSGIISSTVICRDGLKGDCLSTALFVMGEEKAAAYHKLRGGFDAILVTDDGRILVTEGIYPSFTPYDTGRTVGILGEQPSRG